jgi:hypothetical protein
MRYAAGGVTMQTLADEHNVSKALVDQILRNEAWHDPLYTPRTDRRFGLRDGTPGLTFLQVRQIRQRYAAGGETTRSLGGEYGVSAVAISKIIRNLSWIDPDYTPPTR